METLRYIFINIVCTLLRAFPLPRKTGLIKIGNPDRNAPVFLTCNYLLTVERVKRALKGMDCYLLVANSRGINVWCASAGGHLTNHSVISVLKTSRIEELVDHRTVILPQLAATGIETGVIKKKTGWKAIWGPVYAKDIKSFIKNELKKTHQMREVRFPLYQRIEMAVMWAFPFSLIITPVLALFWKRMLLPLNAFFWCFSILLFGGFPIVAKLLNPKKKSTNFSKYTIVFDFARSSFILWGIFMVLLVLYNFISGNFTPAFIFRWGLISLIVTLFLNMDLRGSTPIYKSGLHEDIFFEIFLDEQKCRGAGFCEQVCPRNCYEVDKNRHIATIPRAEKCIKCGACIVQCPFDALYFKTPEGKVIPPDVIRRFKLNLLGKRTLEA